MNRAQRESNTVYLGVDYAAYCIGIKKDVRAALIAQITALMGPIVRWKKVLPSIWEKS